MSANRLFQKNQFLVKLGMLVGPIQRFVHKPAAYDEQDQAELRAQFTMDAKNLYDEFWDFCTSQPGHHYTPQAATLKLRLDSIGDLLAYSYNGEERSSRFSTLLLAAQAQITSIPIPRKTMTFEAYTPYSTYRVLSALCAAEATRDLVWIDAYFDKTIFDLYVGDVRPTTHVTLITLEPKHDSTRDQRRWEAFLTVSRFYAQERGHEHYRLIVHRDGVHDRWVRFDGEKLYQLGGSVKDAGSKQYFTLARLDVTPENGQIIQSLMESGTEYVGPSTPKHK